MPTHDASPYATATAVAAARAAGLEVRAEGGRLVVRGPKAAESLVRPLLADPGAVLAVLAREDAEVVWRIAAMRPQVPMRGPIPVLVACEHAPMLGGCVSCGDPLSPEQRFRCGPCSQATWMVLHAVREGAGT